MTSSVIGASATTAVQADSSGCVMANTEWQQPAAVDQQHCGRDACVTVPATRQPLIGMAAMSLRQSLAAPEAPDQSDRRVAEKDAAQNQPGQQCGRVSDSACNRQHRNDIPQVTAADVTHEYPRGRPVPGQEAECRGGDHDSALRCGRTGCGNIGQQRTAHQYEYRLGSGDAVDAIHEIEQVEHPDDRECPNDESDPAGMHYRCAQLDRR